MTERKVPFSHARQNLTSLVDDVERHGRAVTIERRGKAAAVLVDPETYRKFIGLSRRTKWMLKDSFAVEPGVDVGRALARAKVERIRQWKERKAKLTGIVRGT